LATITHSLIVAALIGLVVAIGAFFLFAFILQRKGKKNKCVSQRDKPNDSL